MIVQPGGRLAPKNQDIGLVGRFIGLTVLGLMLWGTTSLIAMGAVGRDTINTADLPEPEYFTKTLDDQPVADPPAGFQNAPQLTGAELANPR